MIQVNLVATQNYNLSQINRLKNIFQIMEKVLNTADFKSAVLNFKTNGELTFSFKKNPFKHFDIYSNEQVYAMIMQAREGVGNMSDGVIDLYLTLEPGGDGQNLGYGLQDEKEIHTYTDFFDNPATTDATLANHFTHEWCHKLGFEHAEYRWMDSNRDDCSVPYAIGNLVESLNSKSDLA